MNSYFDPFHLDGRSSLNSTRLAIAAHIEPGVHDKRALELLSQAALARAVRAQAPSLGLDPERSDAALVASLDQCLSSRNVHLRHEASSIAVRFGKYLGYLLLTLTQHATPTVLGYSDFWTGVKEIWLGGGLVQGTLGTTMRDTAQRVLIDADSRVRIQVAPYPALLPLIGAARSTTPSTSQSLVYDFGAGSAKHALAACEGNRLTHLTVLPPRPTPELARDLPSKEDELLLGHQLADFICSVVGEDLRTVRERGEDLSEEMYVSLACYLKNNHPLDYAAVGYMAIRHIGPNAGHTLSRELSDRAGRPLTLRLIHDGTAAGRALAGERADAVVMMGTWLGLGFVPGSETLRPLDASFEVRSAGN